MNYFNKKLNQKHLEAFLKDLQQSHIEGMKQPRIEFGYTCKKCGQLRSFSRAGCFNTKCLDYIKHE